MFDTELWDVSKSIKHFDTRFDTGVHWCQCSLGRSGAKAPRGALKRAIYSKNFLQDKGSISDKESISDKGSISDKESISYIISPKNRAGCCIAGNMSPLGYPVEEHIKLAGTCSTSVMCTSKSFDVHIKVHQNAQQKYVAGVANIFLRVSGRIYEIMWFGGQTLQATSRLTKHVRIA